MSQKPIRQKPKVGDRLFSLNIGNAARRSAQKLTPVVVVKVGTKYFFVSAEAHARKESSHMWDKFHNETWHQVTNFTADAALYVTEQEWLDEREFHRSWDCLREMFAPFGSSRAALTLDQLRRIIAITQEAHDGPMPLDERRRLQDKFAKFFSSDNSCKTMTDSQARAVDAAVFGIFKERR